MSRDTDRFKANVANRQKKLRRVRGAPPLFLLTDPETARRVLDAGFDSAGVWTAQAAVTLIGRVPGDIGGAIVSVSVTRGNYGAVTRCEVPDDEFRRFVVPLVLLTDAYLARSRRRPMA